MRWLFAGKGKVFFVFVFLLFLFSSYPAYAMGIPLMPDPSCNIVNPNPIFCPAAPASPVCGSTCTSDANCTGATGGCTSCIAGLCTTPTTTPTPTPTPVTTCGSKCVSNADCSGATDGCTACIANFCTATATATPTTAPICPSGATCSNGNITNLNFGITIGGGAWFQGVGGDMRADNSNGFTDSLPNGLYASLQGSGLTPGIIFSGQNAPNFGQGNASTTNWQVAGSGTNPLTFHAAKPGLIRTSYAYLQATAQASGITPADLGSSCTISNCTLTSSLQHNAYSTSGDLTLNAFTFPAGQNYIILVNGSLFITGNIIVPNTSTVTFSIKGDIHIAIGVTQLEGFYSADRSVYIDGYGNCNPADTTLHIAGAMVANATMSSGAIFTNRNLCALSATNPVAIITERPDMILNAPAFLKHPNTIWQEVAP